VPARIRHITIDCREPSALAAFWAPVLGFVEDPDDPNEPGANEFLIVDPQARHPGLLFIGVPEPKTTKNRIHLDLQPDVDRDQAVDAAAALGATLVADHRQADGTGWVVLADPEGNELCIERSAAERGTPPPIHSEDTAFPDGTATADELAMLTNILEWYRAAVMRKVTAISPTVARTSPLRSGTTIVGLVKHLALVEDSWLCDRFAGSPEPEPWASAPFDDDWDWEFHSAVDEPMDDVLALYELACQRSRDAAEGHSLDDHAANASRPFTLRFAYLHLIEETARHVGHLDILREYLDGTTGE